MAVLIHPCEFEVKPSSETNIETQIYQEYVDRWNAGLWYELRLRPCPYKQQDRPSRKFQLSYGKVLEVS